MTEKRETESKDQSRENLEERGYRVPPQPPREKPKPTEEKPKE